MASTNLIRLINSIGKSTFVRYYREFADSRLSIQDVVAILPQEYTLKSRNSRTSHARKIFRDGLEKEALELILHSERVDDETINQARRLLSEARATRK